MLFVLFVQRTLMSIITVFKKSFPPQSSQPLSRVYSCEKASLMVQPLQLSEFIAAWYRDQVQTQLDRGIKIEEVKVDMRVSVVKPLSAKWIIKAVDELASRPCEIKYKRFERGGILEYVLHCHSLAANIFPSILFSLKSVPIKIFPYTVLWMM